MTTDLSMREFKLQEARLYFWLADQCDARIAAWRGVQPAVPGLRIAGGFWDLFQIGERARRAGLGQAVWLAWAINEAASLARRLDLADISVDGTHVLYFLPQPAGAGEEWRKFLEGVVSCLRVERRLARPTTAVEAARHLRCTPQRVGQLRNEGKLTVVGRAATRGRPWIYDTASVFRCLYNRRIIK